MNTIFFDIDDFNKKNYKENKIKSKLKLAIKRFLKFDIKSDIFNNSIKNNNIYICLDKNYMEKLENGKNKYKKSITIHLLVAYIYIKTKKIIKVNILTSKDYKSDFLNEYINNIILATLKFDKSIENINDKYTFLKESNMILENDIKYINNYITNNKINENEFKILIVLGSIIDINYNQIIKYISNYKFLDILIINNISKSDFKKINNKIQKINDEFGTTIDIIQKRNLQEYNIYLLFCKLNLVQFASEYILNTKSMHLDFLNPDQDYENKNIITYEKYKNEIKTLFNRLEICEEKFSKNKLGALLLKEYTSLDK